MAIHFRPDGKPTPYPCNREEAHKRKYKFYDAVENCPECEKRGDACSIRFTVNDKCKHCARLEAIDYYNGNYTDPKTHEEALQQNAEYYVVPDMCQKAGHLGIRRTDSGECAFCAKERADRAAEKAPREEARAQHAMWYMPLSACAKCGQKAKRRVNNNSCHSCEQLLRKKPVDTPRSIARKAGEMFYTPDAPCEVCGTLSPRRVNNNSCRQCELNNSKRGQTGRQDADKQFMESCPDAVISRADARSLGMGVYRTGKACKNGHTGFRYVSTGACIECLKGGGVSR